MWSDFIIIAPEAVHLSKERVMSPERLSPEQGYDDRSNMNINKIVYDFYSLEILLSKIKRVDGVNIWNISHQEDFKASVMW